jgi:hypothetical protein
MMSSMIASCTMGTGSFPGLKSGRGVTLTPHPLLVPWSIKSRVIPLLPLWAVRPVQSLSACTRVHFTFTLPSMIGLRIWDTVFAVTWALVTKKELSMEHRLWSTVNVVYLCLRDIDCKYPHLPHLDGYRCISVAKMWRNLTTCVEMPIVIPESIHKFNVCIK